MDADLVVRAQQGDQGSFDALACGVWGRLYQLALRILRDETMAEEATERAVVDIWRNLPSLREQARFEAWSYRILVNACNSEARRNRRRHGTTRYCGELVPHTGIARRVRPGPTEYGCYGGSRPA